mgnify:CR=1 FL=1
MSGQANFFDQVTQYFHEAARFTDYPKGLLEQNQRNGKYRLGLHLWELGNLALTRQQLRQGARQLLEELREATGLPGMAVLQFAFGDKPTNLYLPHNLVPNSVIYPGTHDNDTAQGWWQTASERELTDCLLELKRADAGGMLILDEKYGEAK